MQSTATFWRPKLPRRLFAVLFSGKGQQKVANLFLSSKRMSKRHQKDAKRSATFFGRQKVPEQKSRQKLVALAFTFTIFLCRFNQPRGWSCWLLCGATLWCQACQGWWPTSACPLVQRRPPLTNIHVSLFQNPHNTLHWSVKWAYRQMNSKQNKSFHEIYPHLLLQVQGLTS